MIGRLALPVGFALVGGVGAGLVQRRLHPRLAAVVLTSIAVLSALALVWATAAVAFGYLLDEPRLGRAFGWCRGVFSTHDRVPAPVGIAATLALPAMVAAGVRRWRHRSPALWSHEPVNGVEILPCEDPVAFAVPGAPGHIVVSTGMLKHLNADERKVLFAHEQAHLDHRHARYLAVVNAAAAAAPILRPLRARVRFATERWADEIAAVRVGDRRLAARAIAKAALAEFEAPSAAMALTGFGVRARVDALLHDPCRTRPLAEIAMVAGVLALSGSMAASTVQLHHLLAYAMHVCRF